METVIFDLDGTLADIKKRRKHLDKEVPDWKSFNNGMEDDIPNKPIVGLYRTLWESGSYDLIIVSGRSEEYRKFTEQWLSWNHIPYKKLIMRKKNDFRSDDSIKEDILKNIQSNGHNIVFVVDDRQKVVNMWRRNGITCLQCDVGDF